MEKLCAKCREAELTGNAFKTKMISGGKVIDVGLHVVSEGDNIEFIWVCKYLKGNSYVKGNTWKS